MRGHHKYLEQRAGVCRFLVAAAGLWWPVLPASGEPMPDFIDALVLPVPPSNWVWAGSPPGEKNTLFVMNGAGVIRVLEISTPPQAGGIPVYTLQTEPFASVFTSQARSVAFAPDYATSGRLYVAAQVVGQQASVIVELTRSVTHPSVAEAGSQRTICTFQGLTFDHALGSMHFGADGMLYVGVGDGHSQANAQSLGSRFGKMLRIDVGGDDFPDDASRNYRIPHDNPLVNRDGAMPEIWHIGLRNPWRWSFDRWSGDAFICDVGGSRAGEINRLSGAGHAYSNFGWPAFDGTLPTPGSLNPDFTVAQLHAPILSIAREGGQCSTSGGMMYHGHALRAFRGRFLWSDACSGQVYSAKVFGQSLSDVQLHGQQLRNVQTGAIVSLASVSMIAEDGSGEPYIVRGSRGTSGTMSIYRIVAAGVQPAVSDIGGQGGTPGADGVFDANDFIVYIDSFFGNDPRADIGTAGGVPGVDLRLDTNDFIVFIDALFAGA